MRPKMKNLINEDRLHLLMILPERVFNFFYDAELVATERNCEIYEEWGDDEIKNVEYVSLVSKIMVKGKEYTLMLGPDTSELGCIKIDNEDLGVVFNLDYHKQSELEIILLERLNIENWLLTKITD
jgi:hypothetical protein